ncbi:TPA: hypothetical protein ACQGXR_005690 [Pseudomonas aeruginosa]
MSMELNKESVEQAGGDERDFQAKGAQEVPSPVSKEYDRHLISLLRKGEALPGHQEEAADEIERLRDWNDHLNNTVLPNILNPNFLMLMKGGERLLDLCTKDGEFIGVSLNDMKDVFDWMVTHARIAPDQAALAQPSPAQTQPSPALTLRAAIDVANDRFEVPVAKWGTDLVGEEERPEVAEVAFVLRNIGAMDAEDIDGDNVDLRFEDAEGRDTGCDVSIVEYAEKAADLFEQHDRIVGELRADRDSWAEQAEQRLADWDEMRKERDAALAEVERLRESKGDPSGSFDRCMKMMYERDEKAKQLEVALARVAELEMILRELNTSGLMQFSTADEEKAVRAALSGAQAQHSAGYAEARQCVNCRHIGINDSADYAACHDCNWTGPEPDEDKCPGCGSENCMAAACPECGGRYDLVAEANITAPAGQVPQAWLDVQAERRRQITAEGWTPEHDDLYCAAELPRAAAAYILNGANDEAPAIWSFSAKWWKPRDARSNYVRAGALILAEIERLDRAAPGKEVGHE